MKKYLPIVSSIITVLVCIIGQTINQKMDYRARMTFDGTANIISKIFILFFVGICVGWNIWILYRNSKQNITVIVSIILNILVVLIYYFKLNQFFLYPIALIGVYTFMLFNRIWNKRKSV